jgi:hypothetical protein
MKQRKVWTVGVLEVKSRRFQFGPRAGKPYTWRDVASVLWPHLPKNATAAAVHKIVHHPEYNPGDDLCKRLGLVYERPTPVCVKHNVVHCYDCETQEPKPIRKKAEPRPVCQSVRLGNLTQAERESILLLSPEERKAALLEAAARKEI